jgi:hypothetical protein
VKRCVGVNDEFDGERRIRELEGRGKSERNAGGRKLLVEEADDVQRGNVVVTGRSVVLLVNRVEGKKNGEWAVSNDEGEEWDGGVEWGRKGDVRVGHEESAKALTTGWEGGIRVWGLGGGGGIRATRRMEDGRGRGSEFLLEGYSTAEGGLLAIGRAGGVGGGQILIEWKGASVIGKIVVVGGVVVGGSREGFSAGESRVEGGGRVFAEWTADYEIGMVEPLVGLLVIIDERVTDGNEIGEVASVRSAAVGAGAVGR